MSAPSTNRNTDDPLAQLEARVRAQTTSLRRGMTALRGALDERLDRQDAAYDRLADVVGGLDEAVRELKGVVVGFRADVEHGRVVTRQRMKGLQHDVEVIAESLGATSGGVDARLEGVERRIAQLETRMERHLGAIERRRARRLSRLRPGFDRFFELAQPVIASRRTLLDHARLYVLWQALANVAGTGLPLVEAGVYKGGSSYFLAIASRELRGEPVALHAIDTFAGHLPDQVSEFDAAEHHAGQFDDVSAEDVEAYLAEAPEVTVHRGDAVDTLAKLEVEHFGLAHLDVDLYRPTRGCLETLADRLGPGGVVVVDDYASPSCPGVRRAVEEFLDGCEDFEAWDLDTEQIVLIKRGSGKT